jgi:hypothetical protein
MDAAEARSYVWMLERLGPRLEALCLENIERRLAELGHLRWSRDKRSAASAHELSSWLSIWAWQRGPRIGFGSATLAKPRQRFLRDILMHEVAFTR